MSKRANYIFYLTHFYPTFVASHLYFGSSALVWQVLFTVGPFSTFIGLFMVWKDADVPLGLYERFNIGYLVFNMAVMSVYYTMCIFTTAIWIYNHNIHTAIFVLLNMGFYLLFYRKLKRCEP